MTGSSSSTLAQQSFSTIVSVAIPSTKYEIPQLRQQVLLLLAEIFPIRLEDWDRCMDSEAPRNTQQRYTDDVTSLPELVKFIRKVHQMAGNTLDAFLPCALFRLCSVAAPDLILGLELPRRTLAQLVVGQGKILQALSNMVELGLHHTCEVTGCLVLCSLWRLSLTNEIPETLEWATASREASISQFKKFKQTYEGLTYQGKVSCLTQHNSATLLSMLDRRKEIWKLLPEAFGVAKSWDSLLKSLEKGESLDAANTASRVLT